MTLIPLSENIFSYISLNSRFKVLNRIKKYKKIKAVKVFQNYQVEYVFTIQNERMTEYHHELRVGNNERRY
jgi:hypothetical protein